MADVPVPGAKAPAAAAAASTAAGTATKSSKTTTKKSAKSTTTKTKRKNKRKKTDTSARASGASSAASAAAIWNAANAAQVELAQQKATVAARKADPLWYRVEEPVASVAVDSAMSGGGTTLSVLPDQVQLVEKALLNQNMTRIDVTPQAFACLLEQGRRFALELVADAQDYAYAANRHEVSRADLLLAYELRPSNNSTMTSLSALQPRLSHLAQEVNRSPLPPIPTECYNGVLLPPAPHQLTARTFDVVSGAQMSQRMVAPPPSLPASTKKASKKSKSGSASTKTSYGAKRGQQIPIQLKESTNAATSSATATTSTPMDIVPATTAESTAATAANAPTSTGASSTSASVVAQAPGAAPGVVEPPPTTQTNAALFPVGASTAPTVGPQPGIARPPTGTTGAPMTAPNVGPPQQTVAPTTTTAGSSSTTAAPTDGGTKRKSDQL